MAILELHMKMKGGAKIVGRCECGAVKKRKDSHIDYRPWWESPPGKIGHHHEVKAGAA